MSRLVFFCFVATFAGIRTVEGNAIVGSLEKAVSDIKDEIVVRTEKAAGDARRAAINAVAEATAAARQSEDWLRLSLQSRLSSVEEECRPAGLQAAANASLWKCLQMSRIIADGTNIASGGFALAADIIGTVNNFMQSLTACIIGPSQTPQTQVACYLSTLGTIATGVAENIEQVEHYINVVKRDVSDIHAAVRLCRNQTYNQAVEELDRHHASCAGKR